MLPPNPTNQDNSDTLGKALIAFAELWEFQCGQILGDEFFKQQTTLQPQFGWVVWRYYKYLPIGLAHQGLGRFNDRDCNGIDDKLNEMMPFRMANFCFSAFLHGYWRACDLDAFALEWVPEIIQEAVLYRSALAISALTISSASILGWVSTNCFKKWTGLHWGVTGAVLSSIGYAAFKFYKYTSPIIANPLALFHFQSWMRLGENYERSKAAFDNTGQNCMKHSRAVTLQELENWVPYEQVTLKKRADQRAAIFISHRWHTPAHPDPEYSERKRYVPKLKRVQLYMDYFLRSDTSTETREIIFREGIERSMEHAFLSHFALFFVARKQREALYWYDFQSIPQGKDDHSRKIRTQCLDEIAPICQTMPILALTTGDYFSRAWCFFECIQGQLVNKCGLDLVCKESIGEQFMDVFKVWQTFGRFCKRIEKMAEKGSNGIDQPPGEVLSAIGLRCTNGADLQILSSKLIAQACQVAEEEVRESHVMAHPFNSARTLALEKVIRDEDRVDLGSLRIVMVYYENLVKMVNGASKNKPTWSDYYLFGPVLHQMMSNSNADGSKGCFQFYAHWHYPASCMQYLIESELDWEGTDFSEKTVKLCSNLIAIGERCKLLKFSQGYDFDLLKEWIPQPKDSELRRLKQSLEETLVQCKSYPVHIIFSNHNRAIPGVFKFSPRRNGYLLGI